MWPTRARQNDALESRRLEIQHSLVEAGFATGDVKLFRDSGRQPGVASTAERFRELLERLGPIFASFGLYLASRPDLLRLEDCLELERINPVRQPLPTTALIELLHHELGHAPEFLPPSPLRGEGQRNPPSPLGGERLGVRGRTDGDPTICLIDHEPFDSHLLFQKHRAELHNGDKIVLKIIRPDIPLDDLELLQFLRPACRALLSDPAGLDEAISDFRSVLLDSLDCTRQAHALESLRHDTRDYESLRVPVVYRTLCTARVLVTEYLRGTPLARILEQCGPDNEGPLPDGPDTPRPAIPSDELARLLCDVWLRQAFTGSLLPVQSRPEDILALSSTQIALVDGLINPFPAGPRENLQKYLIAVASNMPSKALETLLAEMDGTKRQTSRSNLDRQFRQLVPFRDGGWQDEGRPNVLSETLFAQWQLARQHGFRPLTHLVNFLRGTFQVATLSRRIAPDRDTFLEGIQDLRITQLVADMSRLMQPQFWGGQLDKLASLLMFGPRHLDDALSAASQTRLHIHRAQSDRKSHVHNRWIAAALALVCIVVLHDPIAAAVGEMWAARIEAISFAGLGCLCVSSLVKR